MAKYRSVFVAISYLMIITTTLAAPSSLKDIQSSFVLRKVPFYESIGEKEVETRDSDSYSDLKMVPPLDFQTFFNQPKPFPSVFGSANTEVDVTGLFAHNNNSLTSIAGPNGTAIASLNSTSFYFNKPIEESNPSLGANGSGSNSNNAGYTITSQEDVSAYAEGDWIQFINYGGSSASAQGNSTVDGHSNNHNKKPSVSVSKPIYGLHGLLPEVGWKDIQP